MTIAMSGALHEFVAQNNFGDTRSGSLAGPVGLVIILLLAIATFFLIRNMNQRLRRLPERFPTEPPAQESIPQEGKEGSPSWRRSAKRERQRALSATNATERRGGDPS